MEGHAHVRKFSGKEVDVIITTDDEEWDEKRKEGVKNWVGRLRKMLRLAVETSRLKDSYLHFVAKNRKGECWVLELKDGQLKGPKYLPSTNKSG